MTAHICEVRACGRIESHVLVVIRLVVMYWVNQSIHSSGEAQGSMYGLIAGTCIG